MTPQEFYAKRGSPYGYSPGYDGFHYGQDYPWGLGEPIPSPSFGSVANRGYSSIHGYWVSVAAGGRFLQFCHMRYATPLAVGQLIDFGATVGVVGDTGEAAGYHLHLAVSTSSVPGDSGTRQDPVPFVSALITGNQPAGGNTTPFDNNSTREKDMIYFTTRKWMGADWKFCVSPGYIKNTPGAEGDNGAKMAGQIMNDLDEQWTADLLYNHGLQDLVFAAGSVAKFLGGLGGGKYAVAPWLKTK
jgi:hypothetical protein